MAEFTPKKIVLGDINNGIEFTESDGVTPNAINDPIEAVAYSQTVVEHLTDTPDISEINGEGSPNVSFVSSTTADGVTIHKFKFSNLSGATFTPSLDEAGNLSWSNNRNLPNPPTINISGRDYLFSSEVLSGTYIPQVNSEVTDMPLTSFNRAPVDDIDHCYLFYYYTPENIYYWLATQVVDIQETTATLKILSVVRLTGYTPTIGENGNWFIGGEDTGKPSYGASGVTDVVAGASYNQDDFTITPLTFNFEVGNSKTVNVKAAVGNVEDGSYAKLAQVVRTDVLLPLDDEEFERFSSNIRRPYGKTTYYYNGWIYAVKIRNLGPGRFISSANFLVSDASVVLGLLQVKCLGSSVQGIDSDIKLKYIGFADKGVDFGAKNFKAVIDSDSNTTLNIYINSYSGIGVQLLSDFHTVDMLIEFPFEKTEEPEGGVFAEYFDIHANGVVIGAEFNGKDITEDCTFIRCSGSIVIASGVTVNAIDCPNLTTSGDGTINKYIYENEVQQKIEAALVPISAAIGERLTIKSVELGVVELTPNTATLKYFSDITADGFIPSNIMFLEYLPFQTLGSYTNNNSIVCCKYLGDGYTSRVVCNYGVNGDKVGAISVQTEPTYVRIYNYTGNVMYAIRLYFLGRYNNDNQSANS